MGKQLDPNHLALMTAAANTRDEIREIIKTLDNYEGLGIGPFGVKVLKTDLGQICDKLRLVLKGRL